MKSKNTKQALLASVLSLVVCIAMLIGTTFAWFTDSVASSNNKIVAGDLDVELEYSTDFSAWAPVTESTNVFKEGALWEPGHTEVVYLRVSNKGSLNLKYQLGVHIASETSGINRAGETFLLSDSLKYGVDKNVTAKYADRPAAITAVSTTAKKLSVPYAQKGTLAPKAATATEYPADVVAVVVYMPETVGNEANHNGINIPEIKIGLNLFATQQEAESDSFNEKYDSEAPIPFLFTDSKKVPVDNGFTEEMARFTMNSDSLMSPISEAHVTVPRGAKVTKSVLTPTISPISKPAAGTTVGDSNHVIPLNIEIDGLAADNTEVVIISLDIGANRTDVVLYHKGVLMTKATTGADGTYDYNADTGVLTIYSSTFSPFDLVYHKLVYVVTPDNPDVDPDDPSVDPSVPADLPVAVLTDVSATYANQPITWENYGGIQPNNLEQQLEVVYEFKAKDTAAEAQTSKYADWLTDFYVSCDKDLTGEELVLGGMYGTWGWIGFNNPGDTPIAANTKVPLLGSVANPWQYRDIVSGVDTFLCGVARAKGSDMNHMKGATFSVELRLTNPDNENEYYSISVVNYTFQ